MATAAQLSRIYAAILSKVPKELSPITLNKELSQDWDEIEIEVAEYIAKGWTVEVPFEAPDIQVPAPDKSVKKSIARDEVKTFIKFLSKSPSRPFEFVHVDEIYGEVLNKFVKAGDLDSARMYAERYLA
jgi:hypothetical protein